MKIFLKMCTECFTIYPTIPHKCPKCFNHDYKIVQCEVKNDEIPTSMGKGVCQERPKTGDVRQEDNPTPSDHIL